MALEILLFRSLFRNVSADLRQGGKLAYGEEKLLWLGALAFHWSLLIVVLRHLRFFMEPVPWLVVGLQRLDGFFQVGVPVFYLTDAVIFAALAYLLTAEAPQSATPLHFALFRLSGARPAAGRGFYRHSDEVFLEGGYPADQGDRSRHRDFLSARARGRRADFLRPPFSCERPPGLLPVQQADAHGGDFSEPDEEPCRTTIE